MWLELSQFTQKDLTARHTGLDNKMPADKIWPQIAGEEVMQNWEKKKKQKNTGNSQEHKEHRRERGKRGSKTQEDSTTE